MNKDSVNMENMLKFYKELDVIGFKYLLNEENVTSEDYIKLVRAEEHYQFAEFTKKEYGDILANLDLVYAKRGVSDNIIDIFDVVYQKIVCQYINIDGMERLMSEKYIDFEWDMHLGINYKKHSMTYYRDHFAHQMRDAYMIHRLLQDYGFYEHVKKVLQDQGNSKISRFVYKYIQQQIDKGAVWLPAELRERYNVEEFYYHNIIYMSCYMAALFHDIGYPEENNAVNQKRIAEYMPNLYNTETSGFNYGKLNALLQNSLLFRVVSFEEIKGRLEQEDPDHGTLSAIIFLMHFYENGSIHGLEPYKKCAVETAALAIYNHTNVYGYRNEKKASETNYFRISFTLNPISYILRICDDLQEWDRIYFEISNSSNLIICDTCKTPIVRKSAGGKITYTCNCNYSDGRENGIFQPVFDYMDNFPYRRIYNVTVCDNLEIHKQDGKIIFELQYALDKLLHIAYLSSSYAKYRISELNLMKGLLENQLELPRMYLKYFVTSNLILLKVKIIWEYMKKREVSSSGAESILFQKYTTIAGIEEEKTAEEEALVKQFQEEYERVKEEYLSNLRGKASCPDSIKRQIEIALGLYCELCTYLSLYEASNQMGICLTGLKCQTKKWLDGIRGKAGSNTDLIILIEDCILQFEKMYQDISEMDRLPESYFEQFKAKESVYGSINRFVSAANYTPFLAPKRDKSKKAPGIEFVDAYTDLCVFQRLLQELKNAKGR